MDEGKLGTKMSFRIQEFDDYHGIKPQGDERAIELGCFPSKQAPYATYFGLFYTGRRPGVDAVMKTLTPKVGDYYLTGEKLLEDDLREEVKQALKGPTK